MLKLLLSVLVLALGLLGLGGGAITIGFCLRVGKGGAVSFCCCFAVTYGIVLFCVVGGDDAEGVSARILPPGIDVGAATISMR